jgi:AcrR family transcriptional regulator
MTQVSTRSRRKAKGDGHLRRGEILSAAERIFVEYGYEGATIRKIADEVGVSSTALYMHFRDKNEILVEICSDTVSRMIAANEALLAKDMEPVLRVRQMLEAYVHFGFEHSNAYRLVFCPAAAESPSDGRAELTALGVRCFELFSSAVAAISAAGKLKTKDVAAAAQVLWMAPHGLISLMITQPGFGWCDRDQLIALMLDGVFDGLVI